MGTIQLDYQMPMRFGLTYIGRGQPEHHPVVIHRALLGSLERFIGILIEHYGGAFPFWLAPVQVRILPVGEDHRERRRGARQALREAGFRVDVDERDETVGKRIRDAGAREDPLRDRLRRPRERRVAVGPGRGGEQHRRSRSTSCSAEACYAVALTKQERTRSSPPRATSSAGVQPRRLRRNGPLRAAAFAI